MQLTIMIEGQEGLTWERWRNLARTVEDAGYAGLFRSDHLTGLFGDSTAPLARRVGLAHVAGQPARQRLRFGPLVCPLTFTTYTRRCSPSAPPRWRTSRRSSPRSRRGRAAGTRVSTRCSASPSRRSKERMDRLECGVR